MEIRPLCSTQKVIHNIARMRYSMILPYVKASRKLAATSAFAGFPIIAGFNGAGTGAAFSSQQRVNDSSGTTHTNVHRDGTKRAIAAARPAFHAGIAILNDRMRAVHFENVMGTDVQTHPAARALILVEL